MDTVEFLENIVHFYSYTRYILLHRDRRYSALQFVSDTGNLLIGFKVCDYNCASDIDANRIQRSSGNSIVCPD
jgi:hypothetical protein